MRSNISLVLGLLIAGCGIDVQGQIEGGVPTGGTSSGRAGQGGASGQGGVGVGGLTNTGGAGEGGQGGAGEGGAGEGGAGEGGAGQGGEAGSSGSAGSVGCSEQAPCAPLKGDEALCASVQCKDGKCEKKLYSAGVFCDDDKTVCNGSGSCDGKGKCEMKPAPKLDDGLPCTEDRCDAKLGVQHKPIPGCQSCEADAECAAPSACRKSICKENICLDIPFQVGTPCGPAGPCHSASQCSEEGECVQSKPCP